MATGAIMEIVFLKEHEIRAAARALHACFYAPASADDAEVGRLVAAALGACRAALYHPMIDDKCALMLMPDSQLDRLNITQ